MAKLKNVTNEELKSITDGCLEIVGELWDCASRIEKGYCDHISNPVEDASTLLALSRAAGEVAAKILTKHQMQTQADELKALRSKA